MRKVFGVCSDGWLLCGHNGSPHGSVMSCQSLAARAFTDDKDNMTHCTSFHRSVRFSSESRSSTRNTNEEKKENSGSISLTALAVTPITSSMSQSAPPPSHAFDFDETPAPPPSSCRFPKLEECAHFHYERVSLGTVSVEICNGDDFTDCPEDEGWVCLKVRSHVNSTPEECEVKPLNTSWSEASDVGEWTLYRNRDNLLRLDEMLHRCIYDRKVSGLPNLSLELKPDLEQTSYKLLISDYMHHLSIIADDSINCGPVLNWLQMDNKGHKLLVANEDSSSINTPAVAAAYSVRKYVSQARDEISFEVGDMISIIDMPGPQESLWWRGKRGFRVGFFPHHCVAVIGDKVPRNMTQPPPIVGSVMVAPIKPVLRKHGKLISLFRSFILSRPSRPSLKQQGILKERVFGCDLGEHLLNSGYDVPLVLVECARAIESRGAVDGVYRLSGGTGLTQRLRAAFDAGATALPDTPDLARDPHAVPSLLKMYFRELPNPLCTYQLYESFVAAMQHPDEASKLKAVRQTVIKLPPPHYRTLAYLMRHLRRISLLGPVTGMTPRNMAIVWAPNLLRAPRHQHALQGVAVQAVVTEFLICYAEELFAQEQGADSEPESIEPEQNEVQVEFRGSEAGGRRPKSLPVNPPTKLLSLEEARRRGGRRLSPAVTLPPPSGAIAAAAAQNLRPSTSHKPKYIEVGSGPNNLPQYHTVLDLPVSGSKRGLKRSPSGWRGLFTRSKQHRARSNRTVPEITTPQPIECQDIPMCQSTTLRPVKSCESLTSETDTLAPLADRPAAPLKHHTRSSSCDSYFEPWQAELADMRLRLSPQERDHHMFSEEDDTNAVPQGDSLCSTPPESGLCSVEPSPRRNLRVDIEAANELAEKRRLALEEQVSQLRYIDGESPRARAPPEKRHSARPQSPHHTDIAKRLCKDRETPLTSTEFPNSTSNVKLRDRSSPRKTKSTRYSGLHENDKIVSRLSWHGKDGHSTLIKIDWPIENSSFSNLTTSTLNSTPISPVTPIYDPLETDSEISETKVSENNTNKHTILVNKDCSNCNEETCLKCELKATDYENVDTPEPSLDSDISYKNLNRLSAVSTSSSDHKKDDLKNMTSSHDSSSSYTNSNHDNNDYECFNFTRPNYINLNTSSSSPGSPLKSPLKSTISITFRSPTNNKNMDKQTDRDSIYEDVVLDKNLSIVEEATVPQSDACLPTQQACQPDNFEDLIILETPTENNPNNIPREKFENNTPIELLEDDVDVYSQVKFFKKSIEEVNALITEKDESKDRHYENLSFDPKNDYENINVDAVNICDKLEIKEDLQTDNGNGNIVKETKNLNVRELAIRFESPTEQKGPFFEKFKTEIKFPSLERKEKVEKVETTPKNYKLSKNSARSLDESAFIKEFGENERRKSLEVREKTNLPDLNLNIENIGINEPITPTTENKISLIQRFNDKKDTKTQIFELEKKSVNFETEKKSYEPVKKLSKERIEFEQEKKAKERLEFEQEQKAKERLEFEPEKKHLNFETEKKLSRERIEKYKEERRNFLREKYSSQSFRSNPEQLTRIKIKKEVKDLSPKFERRNTVDLGQRMRFSLAKSANDLDISPKEDNFDRKEKISPTYNIRDMTALFEHKSNNGTG